MFSLTGLVFSIVFNEWKIVAAEVTQVLTNKVKLDEDSPSNRRVLKEIDYYEGAGKWMIFVVFLTSLISIGFLFAREKAKAKWIHMYKPDKGYIQSLFHYQNIVITNNPVNIMSYNKRSDLINVALEVLILAIFPYPYNDWYITISYPSKGHIYTVE